MARLARAELFDSSEVAILQVIVRVTRRCFLFGFASVSGKNFDHRKVWIEVSCEFNPEISVSTYYRWRRVSASGRFQFGD